jgi:excisionase family DNA binding protein
MVQGYYTLDEAAHILGMSTGDLTQMAQRHEVRAFADGGSWRFRTQDIEELARRRGLGSNPEVPLGEAPRPKAQDSPVPKKETDPSSGDEGIFKFALDPADSAQVDLGGEVRPGGPASSSKLGGKSSSRNLGPKSPPPLQGSDSDVRLVADGSDIDYRMAKDSDVQVVGDSGPPSSKSAAKKKPVPQEDSQVRLVPMDTTDSDVQIVSDSSSDEFAVLGGQGPKAGPDSVVRLEEPGSTSAKSARGREKQDSFLTEEIDLDAELRKAEEAAQAKKSQVKAKPPATQPATPATSPFELSEADLSVPKSHPLDKPPADSSSDFDLNLPSTDNLSSIELGSDELDEAKAKDEEIALGEVPGRGGAASDSGINLQRPADSGISLEQGGDSDEIEFELSLDAEASPKPSKKAPPAEDVSSSSEFELTLEDSARLAPLEEEAGPAASSGEEKDIFETDFEVPALEDESGSQAVALDESDTDLESSDFDLALGEEDAAADEESGSQVVALDEEGEVDEAAATVARPSRQRGRGAVAEEEEAADFVSVEEEEEVVPSRRMAAVAAAPADWGVFTPVVLLISTLVMFLLGLMSFELLHGMWGYRQPNSVASPITRTFAEMFGEKLPD